MDLPDYALSDSSFGITSKIMTQALVEVLADKFPGQSVNVNVFINLKDRNTVFYTAIYSWSLPGFVHKPMPHDLHMRNILKNVCAGIKILKQSANWDLEFTEFCTYCDKYVRKHNA